jgi:hypothetical protein
VATVALLGAQSLPVTVVAVLTAQGLLTRSTMSSLVLMVDNTAGRTWWQLAAPATTARMTELLLKLAGHSASSPMRQRQRFMSCSAMSNKRHGDHI